MNLESPSFPDKKSESSSRMSRHSKQGQVLRHPDWKLSADPQFKLDPPTVSNVTRIVLRPLACSQV
jgi:hypothetical protein